MGKELNDGFPSFDFSNIDGTSAPAVETAAVVDNAEEEKKTLPNSEVKPKETQEFSFDGIEEAEEEEDNTEPTPDSDDAVSDEGGENDFSEDDIKRNYEIALQLGTLVEPEDEDFEFDGSEEAIQRVQAHTLKVLEDQGRQALQSKVADPRIWEVVDYAIQGGQFADVSKYLQNQEQEIHFEALDPDKEEDARLIVSSALQEAGLSSTLISQTIDLAIDNGNLDTLAKEYKEKNLETIKAQKELQREKSARQNLEQQARQKEWRSQFLTELGNSKMSEDVKKGVMGSFNQIPLQNGQSIPEYQYKLSQIQSNPKDMLEFLTILSEYSSETGFSNKRETKQKKTTANRQLSSVLGGSRKVSRSKRNSKKGQRDTGIQIV